MEENYLVLELKKGSIQAFDALFRNYANRLFLFAKGLLKSDADAEEIVQEVFVRIWEKRLELNEYKNFKSFVFTIAYHCIISQIRAKARTMEHLHHYMALIGQENTETNSENEFTQLEEIARKTIDKLPQKRREIYIMSRIEGLTNQEIADRLNISKNTVENQITQATKFMKEQLSGQTLMGILFFYLFIQ
jgi:RNA polymerase sigma-70 factor, ECF subfamily